MTNFPLIFHDIFKKSLNINKYTEFINMFIYKNGIRKLITFRNTYAANNYRLLFSKPFNKEMYGIALEKGYAVINCSDKTKRSLLFRCSSYYGSFWHSYLFFLKN